MRVDSIEIILGGIDIPDGSTIGTEFLISTRVRVAKLEQEEIDITAHGDTDPQSTPGMIRCGLVALGKPEVTA